MNDLHTVLHVFVCMYKRVDVLTELQRSQRVFTEETKNCARHMAWVANLIFTKVRKVLSQR